MIVWANKYFVDILLNFYKLIIETSNIPVDHTYKGLYIKPHALHCRDITCATLFLFQFLSTHNVVIVDWGELAYDYTYLAAMSRTDQTGKHVAKFLQTIEVNSIHDSIRDCVLFEYIFFIVFNI